MMSPVVPAVRSAMGVDGVAPRFDKLERPPMSRVEAELAIVHELAAKIDPASPPRHPFRCSTMPHSRATGRCRRPDDQLKASDGSGWRR